MTPGRRSTISIVIPAHNEEAVIARCLDSLLADTVPGELEIIVAANGCTDRTIEIASRYPSPVKVIHVATASKHAALNAGDAAATSFPRVYLDADITLSAATLRALADAMADQGAMVGSPAPRFDLDGCSLAVRSFYRVWCELPWFTDNPVGTGFYMLSAGGHARLGRFPDITNDDQYVHDLFLSHERLCLRTHHFSVRVPRNVDGLVRRRTRTLQGQIELAGRFGRLPGASPRVTALQLLRRRPLLLVDLPAFAVITRLAARSAARKRATGDTRWERDNSTRATPAVPQE